MASNHDLETRVEVSRCVDCSHDIGAGFLPGIPEALRGLAVGADVSINDWELDVGDPISETAAAAEGDDDELVCSVIGYEASDVGED